ncbi:MAG TPA: DUF1080 domain-containing protein [Bryobacteraceae bacterium]
MSQGKQQDRAPGSGSINRRSFLAAAAIPGALGAAAPAAQAQGPADFLPLFDGRTLAGWVIEEGHESSFYVKDGTIIAHESAMPPTWLRSERQFENFEASGEFFIKGWMDSGFCFHAPEHGRITQTGLQLKLFAYGDPIPMNNSVGSIFPVVAPRTAKVRQDAWNGFRILMDWPRLQVWMNGEPIHDLDVESVPELRYRLRRGYFGITTTSYPMPFRNLKVRELPTKEEWITLYEDPQDLANWVVTEGDPRMQALGKVLRTDGHGEFGIRQTFRDFEMHLYVRGSRGHNGGVMFRRVGEGDKRKNYEIQIHDIEEAHYPTGSLYHYHRSIYPRLEPEKWFFMQVVVKGRFCLVRVNGDTVTEYDKLDRVEEGRIEMQAHTAGHWLEYKHIRIKRI